MTCSLRPLLQNNVNIALGAECQLLEVLDGFVKILLNTQGTVHVCKHTYMCFIAFLWPTSSCWVRLFGKDDPNLSVTLFYPS